MKIAIVGLGAMGGLIAARLLQAGHQVQALARGETLRHVRAQGLILDEAGVRSRLSLKVSDRAQELGGRFGKYRFTCKVQVRIQNSAHLPKLQGHLGLGQDRA